MDSDMDSLHHLNYELDLLVVNNLLIVATQPSFNDECFSFEGDCVIGNLAHSGWNGNILSQREKKTKHVSTRSNYLFYLRNKPQLQRLGTNLSKVESYSHGVAPILMKNSIYPPNELTVSHVEDPVEFPWRTLHESVSYRYRNNNGAYRKWKMTKYVMKTEPTVALSVGPQPLSTSIDVPLIFSSLDRSNLTNGLVKISRISRSLDPSNPPWFDPNAELSNADGIKLENRRQMSNALPHLLRSRDKPDPLEKQFIFDIVKYHHSTINGERRNKLECNSLEDNKYTKFMKRNSQSLSSSHSFSHIQMKPSKQKEKFPRKIEKKQKLLHKNWPENGTITKAQMNEETLSRDSFMIKSIFHRCTAECLCWLHAGRPQLQPAQQLSSHLNNFDVSAQDRGMNTFANVRGTLPSAYLCTFNNNENPTEEEQSSSEGGYIAYLTKAFYSTSLGQRKMRRPRSKVGEENDTSLQKPDTLVTGIGLKSLLT